MLVITGASGKTGSKLADTLISKGHKVRVVGRNAGKLKEFTSRGAVAAVGDMADTAFLTRTFTGADAVYTLIPPNFNVADFRAYQDKIGESIVAAIKGSGVKYVVNLSSQGAHLLEGTGPVTGLHAQEERLNRLEGVQVLHLRPTYFMENLLVNIDMIRTSNIMGSAIRGDVAFAMIATSDIASYAASRMVKRDFSGKSIRDLLGERDLSMNEAAAIIGKKLGKPGLTYVTFSYEDAQKGMVTMGLTPDMSRLYVEMSKALNDGLFAVNLPRTMENTTLTSFEDFAETFAEIYHQSEKAA